jgi:hypothetical protein
MDEVDETDELGAEEDEGVTSVDEVEEMGALCVDETEYGELAVFSLPEKSIVLSKASVALPFQITGQEATSTFKFEGTQLHIRRTDPCRIGRLLSVV